MSGRFLLLLSLVCLSFLSACSSSGPFEVTGHLIDASTGENLSYGRLILCPMNTDNTCTISVGLTSSVSDYDDGLFHFNNVMKGSFAILYAADDSLNPAWDTRVINFDNTGETTGFAAPPPIVNNIMLSLGVTSLGNCAISMPISNATGEMVYGGASGYLYSSSYQLAFIIKDGAPLTVQIDGNSNFDVAIWDTTQECDNAAMGEFNPLRNQE